MPWENTEQYVRSGHRSPKEFQKGTLKTILLNEKEGIEAVVGKPIGKDAMEIQSHLFKKDKDWTLEKAKEFIFPCFLAQENPWRLFVHETLDR